MLISVTSIDGSGKSTLVRGLAEEARDPAGSIGSGPEFLTYFRERLLEWYDDRPHLRLDDSQSPQSVLAGALSTLNGRLSR